MCKDSGTFMTTLFVIVRTNSTSDNKETGLIQYNTPKRRKPRSIKDDARKNI
jgi:hypothetical protein